MGNRLRTVCTGLFCLALFSSNSAFSLSAPQSLHQQSCEIFAEQDGLITMETESALLSDDWSLQTGVDEALGTGYYEWKHGNTSGGIDSAGDGILTYTFNITNPGTYRFIIRSAAPHNTEHNDVWARFNSNEVTGIKSNGSSEVDLGQDTWFKVYQNKGNDDWNWAANTVDHNAHQIFANIESPGVYSLQLSGRSTQFKIDRIVLFHESVTQGTATNEDNAESGCFEGETGLRPPEPPANAEEGLQYAYFEGTWSQLPDFTSLDPVKTGIIDNIDLSPRERDNEFGFLFTGYIDAPSDGLYTFYINSDDGSQLFIGDQLVIDNDGTHAESEESGLVALQAGLHPITILFFENAGQEVLSASWAPPGQGKSSLNSVTFMHDADNLLPVELISFTALADYNEVILTWETASELNNAGFMVERALGSGAAFESIGFVEGAGSTSIAQSYTFRDASLPTHARRASYRIKQIDFDGQSEFSAPVHVQLALNSGTQLYSNYPNPFNPSTQISFSLPQEGLVRLSIYDLSGRLIDTLIDEETPAGYHELTFNADASLTSGMYIYRLTTPNETISGTMLLLK